MTRVEPDTVWAARQVIRQHTEQAEQIPDGTMPFRRDEVPSRASGRCAQCDGDDPDCRMLVWARAELAVAQGC